MFNLKGSFNYTCGWSSTSYGQNLQKYLGIHPHNFILNSARVI